MHHGHFILQHIIIIAYLSPRAYLFALPRFLISPRAVPILTFCCCYATHPHFCIWALASHAEGTSFHFIPRVVFMPCTRPSFSPRPLFAFPVCTFYLWALIVHFIIFSHSCVFAVHSTLISAPPHAPRSDHATTHSRFYPPHLAACIPPRGVLISSLPPCISIPSRPFHCLTTMIVAVHLMRYLTFLLLPLVFLHSHRHHALHSITFLHSCVAVHRTFVAFVHHLLVHRRSFCACAFGTFLLFGISFCTLPARRRCAPFIDACIRTSFHSYIAVLICILLIDDRRHSFLRIRCCHSLNLFDIEALLQYIFALRSPLVPLFGMGVALLIPIVRYVGSTIGEVTVHRRIAGPWALHLSPSSSCSIVVALPFHLFPHSSFLLHSLHSFHSLTIHRCHFRFYLFIPLPLSFAFLSCPRSSAVFRRGVRFRADFARAHRAHRAPSCVAARLSPRAAFPIRSLPLSPHRTRALIAPLVVVHLLPFSSRARVCALAIISGGRFPL